MSYKAVEFVNTCSSWSSLALRIETLNRCFDFRPMG